MAQPAAIIRIKNLRLRTFIGIKEEEINNRQDIVINVTIHGIKWRPINPVPPVITMFMQPPDMAVNAASLRSWIPNRRSAARAVYRSPLQHTSPSDVHVRYRAHPELIFPAKRNGYSLHAE